MCSPAVDEISVMPGAMLVGSLQYESKQSDNHVNAAMWSPPPLCNPGSVGSRVANR